MLLREKRAKLGTERWGACKTSSERTNAIGEAAKRFERDDDFLGRWGVGVPGVNASETRSAVITFV